MQTSLALLALALAGLLSLNMSRQRIASETTMVTHEVSALAMSAASAGLDEAAALPFDAGAVPALFTLPAAFGTPAGTFEAATDLDDLHEARRVVTIETPQGSLPLLVEGAVRYVESDGAGGYRTSLTPTLLKELTITATGPRDVHATMRRIFPYRPAS